MTDPYLSIVIPAYNEEARLPPTLRKILAYLPSIHKPFEIVVVDDGSKDKTVELVRAMAHECPQLVLISDGVNRGRGAAVKRGIFAARGEIVLETDSDGSVAEEAIGRFVAAFEADSALDVAFGSRELPGSKIALWQPPLRVFLGYGFIYLTRLMFWMWHVSDFTLGFKMYRRDAARDIFEHQFDPFYVAEAEKVLVAHVRGHKSMELPVTWTDNADSRVRPLRDTVRSLWGLFLIVMRRAAGRYR